MTETSKPLLESAIVHRQTEAFSASERVISRPADPLDQVLKNAISTSKYSLVTFLPKNLWEQFHKLANIYFLIIAVLQAIPQISVSNGVPTTLLPLFFVLAVSGIKDLLEDRKREKSDTEENTRKTQRRTGGQWAEIAWQDVVVGDIIRVHKDEPFSADMILITSSEPKGLCYIETKNLDGETNLKHKLASKETHSYSAVETNLDSLQYSVTCEGPNPRIYMFNGVLTLNSTIIPLNNEQFLLRGSALKNTQWIVGLVVYTGHETKIMLNSARARVKYSSIETQMNRQIIYIFLIQVVICLVCAFIYALWYSKETSDTDQYLDLNSHHRSGFETFLFQFFSWMLLFSNFVPISLIVTLEMVKFLQAKFLTLDLAMYYAPYDMPAKVQSSNLNEELGQISYVFSDKTGTLTCNIMEFRKFTMGGESYGTQARMLGDKVPNVDFVDSRVTIQSLYAMDFFMLLACCHTVVVEDNQGTLEFKASSPDELALVSAAQFFGVQFLGRDQDNYLELNIQGRAVRVKMLNVIEFNSDRKRMSVVCEMPNGVIKLFTKGADDKLLPLLEPSHIIESTWGHLESYALEGLRTLVLASRDLDMETYMEWNERFIEANNDIHNRAQRIEALGEEIEQRLTLVGATAIEDKLQDGVPETIASLKEAGIKVWVLTGDKIETAVNIGYSCRLLNDEMLDLRIVGRSTAEVAEELAQAKAQLASAPPYSRHALLISGDALLRAVRPEFVEELMIIADNCEAVLCCRVSPQQKAQIVMMVRNAVSEARTLGIGDGANDVNMILAAHVGIGISGLEGQQAVRASDFAVAQFCYLQRLLFVHGRESYRKNSTLVCYNFYKNVLVVMPLFWYGFLSVFSAQLIYNNWTYQLFNLVYASVPIVIYALFDREVEFDQLMREPKHYEVGLKDKLFNSTVFWRWLVEASLQGLGMGLMCVYSISAFTGDREDGRMNSMFVAGIFVFGMVTIFANLKVLFFSSSHYWFSWLFLGLSVGLYFASAALLTECLPTTSWLDNYDGAGCTAQLLRNPNFYAACLLICVASFILQPMLRVSYEAYYLLRPPSLPPVPTEVRTPPIEEELIEEISRQTSQSTQRRYTGYAFSGEQGHDLLVTDPLFFMYNRRESGSWKDSEGLPVVKERL
jgi:phospholipid-transporting ATPase